MKLRSTIMENSTDSDFCWHGKAGTTRLGEVVCLTCGDPMPNALSSDDDDSTVVLMPGRDAAQLAHDRLRVSICTLAENDGPASDREYTIAARCWRAMDTIAVEHTS